MLSITILIASCGGSDLPTTNSSAGSDSSSSSVASTPTLPNSSANSVFSSESSLGINSSSNVSISSSSAGPVIVSGALPNGYVLCAGEGQICTPPSGSDVAFGANDTYTFRLGIDQPFTVGLAFFGIDPAPNVLKSAYYRSPNQAVATLPDGYVFCGNEGQNCVLPGRTSVAYGALGSYTIRFNLKDSVDLTNSEFGGDPAPDQAKSGYYKALGAISVTDATCGFSDGGGAPPLEIDNLIFGEVIPHQLVMLAGRAQTPISSIAVTHGSSVIEMPAQGTDFKAFAILEPGLNYVGINAAGHAPLCFELNFQEPQNDYTFRYSVYVSADSQANRFRYLPQHAVPNNEFRCIEDEPCDNQTIAEYMKFTSLMHQFLLAETLVNSGLDRQTFTLQRNADGSLRDPLFYSELTVDEVLTGIVDQSDFNLMLSAGNEIALAEEVAGEDPSRVKHLMIFRDIQSGAWGGGSNGSYGAGTFNSWAANIPQMLSRLYDLRDPRDLGIFFAEQNSVRQNYLNGVGALLHEAGHTLGLSHPTIDGGCPPIMGSGYVTMFRTLLPGEVNEMCWTRASGNTVSDHAQFIANSPWILGVNE